MDDLLARLVDMEVAEGLGDPGGSAPVEAEAGTDPAPDTTIAAEPGETGEGAPSSGEPAAPAWAGLTQEQWEEQQARQDALEDQNRMLLEWANSQTAEPDGQADDTEQLIDMIENARIEGDVRTEFAIMQELNRRAVAEALGPSMPTLRAASDQQAEQAVTGWLNELNVPEADHQDVALFAHGFLRRDDQGNVLPGYGKQAAQQAAARLTERDQRIRADERAKITEEQKTEQERLRQLAGAPATPAGPGGVETPFRDDEDEVAFHRRWRERQNAAAGQ